MVSQQLIRRGHIKKSLPVSVSLATLNDCLNNEVFIIIMKHATCCNIIRRSTCRYICAWGQVTDLHDKAEASVKVRSREVD